MTISSLIHKELNNSTINIIWTNSETDTLKNNLKQNLDINLIDCEQTYFGIHDPDLIICNNRLTNLDKSVELSIYFHIPMIIIDHDVKSSLVDSSKVTKTFIFDPVYQIALDKQIFESWDKIHDDIIEIGDIKKWNDIIVSLSKKFISIKIIE